jgi:hypothetical protein
MNYFNTDSYSKLLLHFGFFWFILTTSFLVVHVSDTFYFYREQKQIQIVNN